LRLLERLIGIGAPVCYRHLPHHRANGSVHRGCERSHYNAVKSKAASTARNKKEACHPGKKRGIVEAHLQGLLRHIGQSPLGMAEYPAVLRL
jgi:hypothetical protein